MKTGILGGTFNPIHNGHLYMAFEAKKTLNLDRIIFVPNYIPPHKEAMDRNPEDVLNMIKLAIENYDDFHLSTYELMKKGLSYTYETLEYFTKTYPNDEIYFIIGEDSYVNFSSWRNPEIIMKLSKLVVIQRELVGADKMRDSVRFFEEHHYEPIILDTLILEVSSSDIRERIKNKREIGYLVPSKVRDYIDEHGLYR
ncbi:nicotinate-nucleotide adenylyltransferase [Proteiniclasticum sp.]|uniref:nicotinate-nucleotide adenylyltransferase n=1 Tax=Proteiniclasticum sp. TaxID=2053595 RepID=UPI00289812F7|nr:nicotinate-nucleotide adenylyltransferase [Proteiniclasticum sp.]